MNKINILYVGWDDWTQKYQVPEYVTIENYISSSRKTADAHVTVADIVILDRTIGKFDKRYLQKATRGHCLFATENVELTDEVTAQFYEGKMGQRLYTGDVQAFLDEEADKYFGYSYGEKFYPKALVVSQFFHGKIRNSGSYNMQLEGNFGEDFTQIAYWRYNIPVAEDQFIDLFLEYQKKGTVELQLKVVEFYRGSVEDIRRIWVFEEKDLQDVVTIGGEKESGFVFISILAKGSGELTIVSLHDRHSRIDRGYFIPGGEREVTSKREEIFTYFEKGDLKPPLAVYFSGYRTQEGFEGYYMMRSFGCPFLLFTDPREEGGAFYIGDKEYEKKIVSTIRSKMKELGFSRNEVVFSGASMGTFGALYYGSDIMPRALLLAKPLTNLGNVAKNERIVRTDGFGTSIDLLRKNYGSLDEDAIEEFNQRLWKKFGKADWSGTEFIISYLYEDDYDPDGYQDILKHLKSSGVQVYGKGSHGRHVDNSASVMAWFRSQYDNVLQEDFHR